ncbi:oxygen-independent coproporphyrinogen-3 oxidase [Peptoniphilus ivorii]|uniref:coproporphyrinogen dehydrogenase HemZ n=1 Tax=Aedoeadaptatus ivorii TaxID=54006 RepID=UPI0027897B05|nr:coproporphyrinogen dehydrogenase HemZ [Peptoniphilus ivorii]MDQ0507859.1 oxygen-independent coproporphyrinogen-3 oxidase [Peptoniphilus ivorii]
MIRIVNATDSEIHTLYELLRIYFPAFETSGELFLVLETTADTKRAILSVGERQYEKTFENVGEYETKRHIAAWIVREVDHPAKEKSLWGSLTGTRPVKFMQKRRKIMGDAARDFLIESYLVHPEIADLLLEIARLEAAKTDHLKGKGYSLYIHIPFCPSRCEYCSYPTIGSGNKEAVRHYMKYLLMELDFVLRKLDKAPATIYIGGGTPTSIAAEELAMILDRLRSFGDREFTLEAGRPETITPELMAMLKGYPVSRISINPQTMVDETLVRIRRPHNKEDILNAYDLVRNTTDMAINMDLILGLDGEGMDELSYTLDSLIPLSPENITVHVLSLKNGSKIFENRGVFQKNTTRMQQYSYNRLKAAGYIPHYLYRQKRILGNGSNIGYSLPGYESLYNMIMMEEIHSVIGVGMSATTKLVDASGKTVMKFSNFRNLRDYTDRFGEVVRKKSKYLGELL